MTEARLVLATVAQRFRLHPRSDRPVAPHATVLLVPRGALPMLPEQLWPVQPSARPER